MALDHGHHWPVGSSRPVIASRALPSWCAQQFCARPCCWVCPPCLIQGSDHGSADVHPNAVRKFESLRTAVSFRHQTQWGDVNSVVSGCSLIGATASRITRNLSDYINDLQGQQSFWVKDFYRQLVMEAGKMHQW